MLCLISLLLQTQPWLFSQYQGFGFLMRLFYYCLFTRVIMIMFFYRAILVLFTLYSAYTYSTYPSLWGIQFHPSMWCNHWYCGHNLFGICKFWSVNWWEFSFFFFGGGNCISSTTQNFLIISLSGALSYSYVLYLKANHSHGLSFPGDYLAWLQSSYRRAISTSSALMYFSEWVKRFANDVTGFLASDIEKCPVWSPAVIWCTTIPSLKSLISKASVLKWVKYSLRVSHLPC